MKDILEIGKQWLTIGSTGRGQEVLPFYLEHFSKTRQKLGIRRKVLISNSKKAKEYVKKLKKQKYCKVKTFDVNNPQTIWVYGNKVAIILVSIEHPIVFLIENKQIANSYKKYFNLLWSK